MQEFERYMETSTVLLPRTRTQYAYEVRLFARVMDVSSLEEITPALLLQWNTMLHDAGGATGTVGQKHAALARFFSFLEEFQESQRAGELLRALRRLSPPGPHRHAGRPIPWKRNRSNGSSRRLARAPA
ncbi:MAG: site-specific integrase [Dehalococcoidia bacterium]